jgi:hypothetical protein
MLRKSGLLNDESVRNELIKGGGDEIEVESIGEIVSNGSING